MRYNLATLAELRTFKPIPYVVEIDGEQQRFEAMLVAVGNGPSFGGGLRITEGAVLDDGLLDVVVIRPMSKRELLRSYPKLFKGTHVHHPDYRHRHAKQGHDRGPRHHGLRRRRAHRPAAADRRGRAAGPARAGSVSERHDRPVSPPSATSAARRNREHPLLADFASQLVLQPRRLPGARLPRARGRPLGAGRRADRLGQDDRRRVRRAPGAGDRPQGFYTTPIKALSNQKFNDLVRRYGADKVGLLTGDNSDQRRGAGGRDDHRGAAQHALRRLADPRRASASW